MHCGLLLRACRRNCCFRLKIGRTQCEFQRFGLPRPSTLPIGVHFACGFSSRGGCLLTGYTSANPTTLSQTNAHLFIFPHVDLDLDWLPAYCTTLPCWVRHPNCKRVHTHTRMHMYLQACTITSLPSTPPNCLQAKGEGCLENGDGQWGWVGL